MKAKGLLAAFLLAVGLCFVPGMGRGEDISPEVLEVVPDRVWKMIDAVKKKEAEPSEMMKLIDKIEEGGFNIVAETKTGLLQSTLDYIMWNPHDFLFIHWEWDYMGLFHVNHALPENIIGKTEGKLVIQVFDNRNVFTGISEVALLEQFKKELERVYHYAPRGFFSKMDRDVVALFYDYKGTPLGYFYQGAYHLREE